MPEGHHIHRLARDLREAFGGRRVSVSSPQGRFADAAAMLDGRVLTDAWAVGKHLFVGFAPDEGADAEAVVHIHLGLIGKLRPFPWPGGPGAVRLRIGVPEATVFDLAGPQTCALLTPAEAEAVRQASGPDPLDPAADPERAWRRVSRSARPIGALLMEQSMFAGVGNLYRAEVLYRAKLDPYTPGKDVSRRTFNTLWRDLLALMPQGVEDDRIDTVRPEHSPQAMGREPRVDRHGGEVYVYRRHGQPCLVCGATVVREDMAGRHLYRCPRCQKPRRRQVTTG